MANILFQTSIGSSIAFNPAADVLQFTLNSAAAMSLAQSGPNVLVSTGLTSTVTLLNVTISQLLSSNFSFADGSVARIGTSGADNITSSAFYDYIDIRSGGSDVVSALGGNDVILKVLNT